MNNPDQATTVQRIRTATEQVFSTMVGFPVQPGEPYREETTESHTSEHVTALISLTGAWVGLGCIECTPAFACRASGAMLLCEYDAVNEDVLDAIAEIANMIIGSVKSALEDEHGEMSLGIPTVIFGCNYRSRSLGVKEWLVVPFDCDSERIHVKLGLAPNHERQAVARP